MRKIDHIFQTVADVANLYLDEVTGPRRWRILTRPRFICYYLARQEGYSYGYIAKAMGRDHSTVISGVSLHDINMKHDPLYARLYNRCVEALENRSIDMVVVPKRLTAHIPQKPEPIQMSRKERLEVEPDFDMNEMLRRGSGSLLRAIRQSHPERFAA